MPLKTHIDEEPSLNLTPMVDVVFQLILFFLLGTKFTEMERKIGLEIPRVTANQALTAAPERQVVNVYPDGQITLDGAPVTLEQLVEQLGTARQQYADLGVLVRGDAHGPFQQVAEVLNACKRAGIQELGISVLPVNTDKK
ncbi:MAG: biopolymer transporter ExbD [Thermoguttaceae bacterium]|jgi:biopolymer transport protein ExbD|nr:biopolymer transporter ExbD [Thermoguttaceae bacterium]